MPRTPGRGRPVRALPPKPWGRVLWPLRSFLGGFGLAPPRPGSVFFTHVVQPWLNRLASRQPCEPLCSHSSGRGVRAGGGTHRSRRGEETVALLGAHGLIPPRAPWTHQAGKGLPDFLPLLHFSRRGGGGVRLRNSRAGITKLFCSSQGPGTRWRGEWSRGWGVGAGQKGDSVFHK